MFPANATPWVEAFRPYLRLLGSGKLSPVLAAKVDLSGIVQQTLAECATVAVPSDEESARGLLRAAFLNNLRDAVRYWTAGKRDARRELAAVGGSSASDLFAVLLTSTTPSEAVARRETELRLTAALAKLPADQRTAVLLHHLLELPVGETAKAMDKSVAAVAGLLRRGLQRLRQLLADRPTDDEATDGEPE